MKILTNFLLKFFKQNPVPGYLGRDLAQHRVHTTKYEDLCK